MANRFSLDIPDVLYQPARPIDALMNSFDKAQAVREEKRRWEIEQRRQAAKDEQFARQNSIAEQRLGMQDAREQQKFGLDLADRSGKQVGDVASLAAQGRLGEAEAKAAASQYTDPKTGQMRSIQFDRGGEREQLDPNFEPLRLDEPGKTGPMSEPRDYSGLREALPIWGKGEAPAGGLKLQGDFASALPIGQPAPAPESFGKKTVNVNPSITTPGGQRVEFDPAEAANFKAQESQKHSQQLAAIVADQSLPAGVRQAAAVQMGLTGAQATGAERAAVTNSNGQEDAQVFTAGQADKFQQTAADKNRLGAARIAAKGTGKSSTAERGDKRLALQEEGAARQLAKDVLSNYGFREVQANNRKFNDMAATVSTDPNAALDAVTAGSFVKMAQGGTGVISDSDMEAFWNRIGGVEDRSGQWVSNVLSGKITPEKREKVAEAVKWLGARAGQNLGDIQGAMDYAFKSSKNLSGFGDQMTGTYFSGARKPAAAGGGQATGGPKEGDTKTVQGFTVTFKNGKWQ